MNGLKNLGTKSGLLHSPARIPPFCHYGQQTLIWFYGKENAIGPHFWCCKKENITIFLEQTKSIPVQNLIMNLHSLFYYKNVTCSATVK
jgi:hypothetical protein